MHGMWLRLGQMDGAMPIVRYMELDEGAGDTSCGYRPAGSTGFTFEKTRPLTLAEIATGEEPRIDMHDEELNRVLGGGLVPGRWCC